MSSSRAVDERVAVGADPETAAPLLELRSVAKAFGGKTVPFGPNRPIVPVLRDVSLEIRPGEIVVLCGANGSGKTTLLKIVAGLITPDSGVVGVRMADGVVGFSSGEERSLYWRLSARHNLEFAGALHGLDPREARSRADALLAEIDLLDRADVPVRDFSSGQKQRLLIGCALMGNPSLLLLDEPTGHMDEESSDRVWSLLRERADRGSAVLMASHRDDDAARAGEVETLSGGLLQRHGPHQASADSRSADSHRSRHETTVAAPANGPAMLWRMLGFLRRDFAIARSYPFGLGFQLVGSLIGVMSLYFLSHVVGSGSSFLHPYGGDYFAFAVLGTAALTFQVVPGYSFAQTVRDGQLTGTLEALLVRPVSLPATLVGSALWGSALAALEAILLVGFAILFFGMRLHATLFPLIVVVLALGLLSAAGLGFLEAAFVLVFKRGSPVSLFVAVTTNLLGGILYPIAVLPIQIRWLAGLLPVTHSANALRLALLTSNVSGALREAAILSLLSVVYLAAGLVAVRAALAIGRAIGTLGQY